MTPSGNFAVRAFQSLPPLGRFVIAALLVVAAMIGGFFWGCSGPIPRVRGTIEVGDKNKAAPAATGSTGPTSAEAHVIEPR